MGNSKPAVEKKQGRKKGRPSLLDLQKRSSLHLQNPNPNPSLNPYLRFPSFQSPARRSTRRNPNPGPESESDSGGRPQKKLKLVHRLPHHPADSALSGFDSGEIRNADRDQAEEGSSFKATAGLDGHQAEETVDSGPTAARTSTPTPLPDETTATTTPLPDNKLLLFILDRLQRKDTHRVYARPADPRELPDYYDLIEHPMDFSTVRQKLSDGAYSNLEEFEKDVFLISSNAMRYNAPSTIYHRQAKSIRELAKKSFENLRKASDGDDELEQKIMPRRGRPPTKDIIKRPVGRPVGRPRADHYATHTNADDSSLPRKRSASDSPDLAGISTRSSANLPKAKTPSWREKKAEKNEECSGSVPKGSPLKYGKTPLVIDENRRNTYIEPLPSSYVRESPLFSIFDGERRQLVPVGLHTEHAYARSLARFAANLGPIGWDIAAKKIESVLPPGTKFGRGWVGDDEAPVESQPPLLATAPLDPSPQDDISPFSSGDQPPETIEPLPNKSSVGVDSDEDDQPDNSSILADVSYLLKGGGSNQPNISMELPDPQPAADGVNTSFGTNLASELARMARPTNPDNFNFDSTMTHGRVLDMVSRGGNVMCQRPMVVTGREEVIGNLDGIGFGKSPAVLDHDPRGNRKPDSVPADLSVRSHSPGSPTSSVVADSQELELASDFLN